MSKTIGKRIAQFVPTELSFDPSLLSESDRRVLKKIVGASRSMDQIFLRQVSPRNPEWLAAFESSERAEDKEFLSYYDIMAGPWDRLEEHRPFVGEEEKPLGAGFYPPDLGKREFEDWLAHHPEDEEAFTSYYTVIRRDRDSLVAAPYSEAYQEFLEPAARHLEEAAEASDNASLSRFLRSRAHAFRTNDYFQSDADWVDVEDSLIDVTIGPYEVYEDRLLGYKAAFEAIIGIKDPRESEKLEELVQYLPELEANLPSDEDYTPLERGESSPISVVSEVYGAGEARVGVLAFAFILPNDEKVRQVKGSKKVMLKNVGEAKFLSCTVPAARRLISEEQLPLLNFEALFDVVLMHELAHGMGPGLVTRPDGSRVTVSRALVEHFPVMEEAKADLAGMWSLLYLVDRGMLTDSQRASVSYIASLLHTLRFGVDTAHGRAALLELNFLLERGGLLSETESGKFLVDYDRMREAILELTRRVLMIQSRGSYGEGQEILDTYGVSTPPLERAMAAMEGLPVDIKPLFPIEEMMRDW
jgi:hypothetical protein